VDGVPTKAPANVFAGGENRYEDWVYLMMLEREWKRELSGADYLPGVIQSAKPSPRASVVLVFWSYFETRINRLIEEATRSLPTGVARDLLKRHSQIGSRLERLYNVLFATTYWSDLENVGYANVANALRSVQQRRNRFVHGHPEAIDDELVLTLVGILREEHEAWITVFNHRVSKTARSPA
jgi:hypothetical protein